MRRICCLIMLFLLLVSCAPQNASKPAQSLEYALATQRLGEQYYNSGNYTLALKKLLEAYDMIPDDPYLNNSLGLVYLAKDRYNLAIDHFKRALSLKIDFIEAKNNLGAAYMRLKQWDKAIPIFKQVADDVLYPTPEVPLSNLGWTYFHMKRYRMAKAYFKRSLDIRPDFLNAIHGTATVLTQTGYHYQAIDYLQRMLIKNPGAAVLHADLARIYEIINRPQKAKKYWQAVVDIEPETSPLAREAEERLYKLP